MPNRGGGGGSVYWGRKERGRERGGGGGGGDDDVIVKGIVVMFSWVSISEREIESFVHLYSSLGWNSLVSHSDFLSAFYPDRALSQAFLLLNELVQELRARPCPVVFVAFSGGSKACMYRVFQIVLGRCEGHLNLDESQLLRSCVSGQIYDSSPVDFTSELGARYALHPAVRKLAGPMKFASWVAKGIASGLDGLYLTSFESQRAEYWQALYSSIDFGAPYLILCSDNDNLVPCQVIWEFTQRLQDLGGDVKLVKWNGSSHLGHYRQNPIWYRAAVSNLLEKTASVFTHKIQLLREGSGWDGVHDDIPGLICSLQKAAVNSNNSLRRVAVDPGDHFFVPSSAENHCNKESETIQDDQKQKTVFLPNPPSINAHSILGQMLFDACVPRNVEGWDIKFNCSVNGQSIASAQRHTPFNGTKRIRRSRL